MHLLINLQQILMTIIYDWTLTKCKKAFHTTHLPALCLEGGGGGMWGQGQGGRVPVQWIPLPCEQTEMTENITFSQLRWRTVIIVVKMQLSNTTVILIG